MLKNLALPFISMSPVTAIVVKVLISLLNVEVPLTVNVCPGLNFPNATLPVPPAVSSKSLSLSVVLILLPSNTILSVCNIELYSHPQYLEVLPKLYVLCKFGIILLFTSALKSMLSVSASPKRTNAPPIVKFPDTSKSALIVTFSGMFIDPNGAAAKFNGPAVDSTTLFLKRIRSVCTFSPSIVTTLPSVLIVNAAISEKSKSTLLNSTSPVSWLTYSTSPTLNPPSLSMCVPSILPLFNSVVSNFSVTKLVSLSERLPVPA